MRSLGTSAVRSAALAASAFVLYSALAVAQGPSSSNSDSSGDATTSAVRNLQEELRQLRTVVEEMRAENAQTRAEMQQLRHELQSARNALPVDSSARSTAAGQASSASSTQSGAASSEPLHADASADPERSPAQAPAGLEERVQALEESTSLLGSKVNEQYGTKVESASKYRTRLSGIVLMNAFHNTGNANNLDFPDFAQLPAQGTSLATIGATLRQSEIGFEIFGPNLAGAKTSANIQLDFAGGFPTVGNGVNFGIARLQTASLHFDWGHTSVIVGQDSLFVSPLTATSFASLATPTFAFGGKLWGWIPQVRVERRFNLSDQQTLTLQAGVLDNLDWEGPSDPFFRGAQAGEQSGQPASAARVSWSRRVFQRNLSFGAAGNYGRQDWTWGRYVDAWAGMADWQIPILARLTFSGEFYRGRGIGGLGAAQGRSILWGAMPSATAPIRGLNDVGGWSQIKVQLTPKLEANGAFGIDDALTNDIRGFATDADNGPNPILGRNRTALGNLVFRPRSDLLFAAEFRRLHSFAVYSPNSTLNQVNLAMGILF